MTKAVRIENADTNTSFKVVVEVWNKGADGAPDTHETDYILPNPADMTSGLYLTSTRYLVIKEA